MRDKNLPDKKAFKRVCVDLAAGKALTMINVGDVFGQPFWVMMVFAFLDAGDAARAIQNAMIRLKEGKDAAEKEGA